MDEKPSEQAMKHTEELEKLRRETIGQLLERKFVTQRGNDYSQFILDMEFDRRKVNRDMWVSRWISFGALAVSIIAVIVSLLYKHQH